MVSRWFRPTLPAVISNFSKTACALHAYMRLYRASSAFNWRISFHFQRFVYMTFCKNYWVLKAIHLFHPVNDLIFLGFYLLDKHDCSYSMLETFWYYDHAYDDGFQLKYQLILKVIQFNWYIEKCKYLLHIVNRYTILMYFIFCHLQFILIWY